MKIKQKILLIGPMPTPINGVSICNELIANKFTDLDVSVIDTANRTFNENIGKFSVKKVFFSLKPYLRILKIIKSDLVYMTIGQTFFGVIKYYPFFVISKFFNKEVIIHIHGNFLGKQYEQLTGFKKKIFKHILKKADKGIVLSESLKSNLTPFLEDKKIYVLYNFVEQQLVDISKYEIENKPLDQLRIVYLSNLMTEKGIFDLLNSFEFLEQKKIPFSAKIAGNIDPVIIDKIKELLKKYNTVEYVGVVRGEAKKNLLLKANTFVFPTYYQMEGQPISILEAMATGNIVLTTKHAGIPDIFSKNNGFYIEKQAPKDIALKLEYVFNNLNDLKYMMLKNHLYVKNNFTESIFLTNLANILIK